MVIVRIHGGVGNQMFQYACAKYLAKHLSQDLQLDLSFFPSQGLRAFRLSELKLEYQEACPYQADQLRGKEGLRFKLMRRLGMKVSRPSSYIKESQSGYFEKDLFQVSGDVYLDGYWQNEHYFTEVRNELIEDFSLRAELSREARIYREKIGGCNAISLHVRRGDYVTNKKTNTVHGICSLEYYKRAAGLIESKVNDPVFFVFSDDIAWCRENLRFLSCAVFITNTKSELEDLELMKCCSHHVIANSSFSWWGAWLSPSRDNGQVVVAPEKWFVDRNKSRLNIASLDWFRC